MKTEEECKKCKIEQISKRIDSWTLSILCGVLSGLVGCGLGFMIYYRFIG